MIVSFLILFSTEIKQNQKPSEKYKSNTKIQKA